MKRDRTGERTTDIRIRIEPELKDKIQKLGVKYNVGMSYLIRKAIERIEEKDLKSA